MARLDALVRGRFELSWGKARDHIATGKVWAGGKALLDPATEVPESIELELRMSAPRPGKASRAAAGRVELPRESLVYSDSQLVVVNKPSGISTVPFGDEGGGATLDALAARSVGQARLEVVHRLDRGTSGLLVFARTAEAARKLANQFRFHAIRRRYLALAHGEARSATIRSELVADRGDGLRGSIRPGSRVSRAEAKEAVTHVRALCVIGGMTLIECRLETGRTHQIRIHLSEAGHPLLGERAYVREYRDARIEAPRIMLHAAELGLIHPTRETPMRWVAPPPADFQGLLDEAAREALDRRMAEWESEELRER